MEIVFWKAKVADIASHGNSLTYVSFELLEDNGMLSKNGEGEGILIFDEIKDFPYQVGDVIELTMRRVDE